MPDHDDLFPAPTPEEIAEWLRKRNERAEAVRRAALEGVKNAQRKAGKERRKGKGYAKRKHRPGSA